LIIYFKVLLFCIVLIKCFLLYPFPPYHHLSALTKALNTRFIELI